MLGLQFLYPSEEESYKVLSFLLDKHFKSSSDASDSKKGRSTRFANEGFSNSNTFAMATEAIYQSLEDAKQNDGTAGAIGSEDATSVPCRVCPLQLASINTAPCKKTSPLITLPTKSKAFLIPSVLELNRKNALMRLLHGQLGHLALEAQIMGMAETADVRVTGKGPLQDLDISSYLDVETNSLSRRVLFNKGMGKAFPRKRIKQVEGEGKAQYEESASSSADGHADRQQRELTILNDKLKTVAIDNSKLKQEIMVLKEGICKIEGNCETLSKQLGVLKEKHDLIRIASELALDSTQTEESKILQSKMVIEESQQRLADSKIHWNSVYTKLETKKSQLELSALTENEELEAKVQESKNVQQQIRETIIKLEQREEQLNELTLELEKGTKGPPRSTYVRRITELIKNSKKQDTDISCIIRETRDLQRESNANQGRLKRTYALVDELVFRDAKKDPMSHRAYRLLTSIHEDFSDCYDKVFAMDKIQREIAELQATLETMGKRPVDLKKIQADFDALVAENLSLEKSLQESQAIGS